ncbi:MAG: trypsin-like peptidase domain-containing protein [Planctomycetota bacterium]
MPLISSPRWSPTLLGLATMFTLATAPASAQVAAEDPVVDSVAAEEAIDADVRDSVVKIHTTARYPNLFQPWRKEGPSESSGTGVIIAGERIITNAHVVNYASRVYVQGYQSADRVEARVVAFAPGVDLAMLEIVDEDAGFFEGRPPLPIADELPAIRGDISAFGYPVGGDDLSVTRGIVSRIEVAGYNHGFIGLRIQVDAALNPGNSGGPALIDKQIVGIVFSGIGSADNIGYLIPAEEVLDFIEDAEDGTYDGRPELQLGSMQTLENEALRDKLGLDRSVTGMMVTTVPDGIDSPLQPWDVITHIGEHDIDNEGQCPIRDDLRGDFRYFVHDLVNDEGTVEMTVIRDGESITIDVPAPLQVEALMPSLSRGNDYPRYYIYGPLVFSQVTDEVAGALPPRFLQLFNYIESPLVTRIGDTPAFEGEELVVVAAPMFDHRITKGYDGHHLAVVSTINGQDVTNLESLVTILNELEDEFVVIEFMGIATETLVFKRQEIEDATEEILTDNGIRYQASRDLRHLLPDDE